MDLGFALVFDPCNTCSKKDMCSMCELTFRRKGAVANSATTTSEWISVEERLPSEDEQRDEYGELVPFLVCEKDTKYPYRAFYDGTIWGDGLMKIKGITHWMPLPEAPTEKGGEQG